MHTSGKVFVVLNVLMLVPYALFLAPIIEYRLSFREKIANEIKTIPALVDENMALDRQKIGLQRDIAAKELAILHETIRGMKERADFEAEFSKLTDARNAREAQRIRWNRSLQLVQQELEGRQKELDANQRAMAQKTEVKSQLTMANEDLDSRLERARTDLEQTQASLAKNYDLVTQLAERWARENPTPVDVAGAGR